MVDSAEQLLQSTLFSVYYHRQSSHTRSLLSLGATSSLITSALVRWGPLGTYDLITYSMYSFDSAENALFWEVHLKFAFIKPSIWPLKPRKFIVTGLTNTGDFWIPLANILKRVITENSRKTIIAVLHWFWQLDQNRTKMESSQHIAIGSLVYIVQCT